MLDADRFCNLIYFWLIRNAGPDDRRRRDEQLARPPAGETPRPDDPVWSADAEMSAFTQAARATSTAT